MMKKMAGILRMVGKFFEWTFDTVDWLLLNDEEIWSVLDEMCEEGGSVQTYRCGYWFDFSRDDGMIKMKKSYRKGGSRISIVRERREGWRLEE